MTSMQNSLLNADPAPTQLAIYELMLADEAAIAEGGAPRSEVAIFLNEGILIQEEQYVFAVQRGGCS